MNFQPKPELEKAVEDCTDALKIDPKYNRAMMRRATALEKLGRLEDSLRGMLSVNNDANFGTLIGTGALVTCRLDRASYADKIPRRICFKEPGQNVEELDRVGSGKNVQGGDDQNGHYSCHRALTINFINSQEREPRLPPHSFVDAYFGAFRPRTLAAMFTYLIVALKLTAVILFKARVQHPLPNKNLHKATKRSHLRLTRLKHTTTNMH
jgi:import receptor subunit TOM70